MERKKITKKDLEKFRKEKQNKLDNKVLIKKDASTNTKYGGE